MPKMGKCVRISLPINTSYDRKLPNQANAVVFLLLHVYDVLSQNVKYLVHT